MSNLINQCIHCHYFLGKHRTCGWRQVTWASHTCSQQIFLNQSKCIVSRNSLVSRQLRVIYRSYKPFAGWQCKSDALIFIHLTSLSKQEEWDLLPGILLLKSIIQCWSYLFAESMNLLAPEDLRLKNGSDWFCESSPERHKFSSWLHWSGTAQTKPQRTFPGILLTGLWSVCSFSGVCFAT